MKSLILTLLITLFVATSHADGQAQAQQASSELSGYVTLGNRPAKGVTLTIGGYAVSTDGNGYYKFSFLQPGTVQVSVTPPSKQTRVFAVVVGAQPTRKDFPIDW